MDTKSIMVVIIGLMVSGLILVSFVPIFTEVTATEKTFTNDGLYYMTDFEDEESITYTYDGVSWTVNGEPIEIDSSENYTIVAGNGLIVRANGYIPGIASPKTIESMVVTATGLSMEYTKTDDTQATLNRDVEIYYCVVNEQTEYTLSQYDVPVYVNGDSDILGDGFSSIVAGTGTIFLIEGNINDGFTVTPKLEDVTVSDVNCNYEEVAGYEDLYKVNSITFTSTYNDNVREQTYTSYVVPAEVTAEKSVHGDDVFNTVINIIPLLAGVGLLMAGVYYFITRK